MTTILVVDDKANVRLLLDEYLSEQGFRVVTAANGREALFVTRETAPDLILLDIMMPEMDGLQFLTHLRRERQTPVIIITARDEESDAVIGLELGADDYVMKPFRMRELTARVRAVLRRHGLSSGGGSRLSAGALVLDPDSRLVTVDNRPVDLTPTEYNLLATLMRAPNRAFSREALLNALVATGYTGLERTINVHIRNLRAKIEPDPAAPTYIQTVFGIGYRLAKDD